MKKIRNRALIVTAVLLVAVLMCGCDLFVKKNDGNVDLYWYMGLTYEDEDGNDIVYTTDTGGSIAAVAMEDGYADDYGIVVDDDVYLCVDTVKKIDERFYWDAEEKLLLFTDANDVFKVSMDENLIIEPENEIPDYTVAFEENGKCYVNMKFVTRFVDMDCDVYEGDEKMPERIVTGYLSGEKTTMKTSSKVRMRTKDNYQNLIVTTLNRGTKVTVLEEGEDWCLVSESNGFIGYVPSEHLGRKEIENAEYESDDDSYTHSCLDEDVSMVWNQVYNQTANGNFDELFKHVLGVNVVSPTWFSISGSFGGLSSLADADYVEKAHKKGLEVWALINDFDGSSTTTKVLSSTLSRQELVGNIMSYVEEYDLDGINIDFEYVTSDAADSYLQFLREMSIECRKSKTVLSVDNYVPSDWNSYYDMAQEAKLADYVVIMNYDEHTQADGKEGSVSSIGYFENAIQNTIKLVGDAGRVISGIPFYTRIWEKTPVDDSDGSGVFVEDSVNGDYYLTSKAVGMDTAKKTYENAGAKPYYDEETGQNFVTYDEGSSTFMIWLEDETSIEKRLEIISSYDLAGSAYWALGQESDDIWDVISKNGD